MFREVKVELTLPVPAPYTGGMELLAAEEYLDSKLLKYDANLQGALVCYSDLRFGSDFGTFQDEQPDVLFTFACKLLLFAPKQDDLLTVRVTTIEEGHIIAQTAGVFNVLIPSSKYPEHAVQDKGSFASGTKRKLVDKRTGHVLVEEDVEYCIRCTKVASKAGTLQLEGSWVV